MTSPYVLNDQNSVHVQAPPGGFTSQRPAGGFQSFLNSLQQPQQQNGMQQRRKGILGGIQEVMQPPSSMGSVPQGGAIGAFSRFML
jgi:hypothetical protein